MMSYIVERRAEEKERRRKEILDAAEAVAVDVGIDALTMNDVARRCRVSRALLYVYFDDKTALILLLRERGYPKLRERFEQTAIHAHCGIDQICAIGRSYFAFAGEWPVYFEVIARLEASGPEREAFRNTATCVNARMWVHRFIVATVERGQRDGSIVADQGWRFEKIRCLSQDPHRAGYRAHAAWTGVNGRVTDRLAGKSAWS